MSEILEEIIDVFDAIRLQRTLQEFANQVALSGFFTRFPILKIRLNGYEMTLRKIKGER